MLENFPYWYNICITCIAKVYTMKENMLKITIALLAVFVSSCARESGTKQTIKGSTYLESEQEAKISYSQAIQPENVTCPKCNQRGIYIHSFINSDAYSLFFSEYKCLNKHRWLIIQNYLNGPIIKTTMMDSK